MGELVKIELAAKDRFIDVYSSKIGIFIKQPVRLGLIS